jgi:hypothetical protein
MALGPVLRARIANPARAACGDTLGGRQVIDVHEQSVEVALRLVFEATEELLGLAVRDSEDVECKSEGHEPCQGEHGVFDAMSVVPFHRLSSAPTSGICRRRRGRLRFTWVVVLAR